MGRESALTLVAFGKNHIVFWTLLEILLLKAEYLRLIWTVCRFVWRLDIGVARLLAGYFKIISIKSSSKSARFHFHVNILQIGVDGLRGSA